MSLSYTIPVAGSTLNSIADPEVATALGSILTWANGGIAGADLSPAAGITLTQLASGVARLIPTVINANTTASDGHCYIAQSACQVTLPAAPTAGAMVAVIAGSAAITGAAPVIVVPAASQGIYGVGMLPAAPNLTLGTAGAFVRLCFDGTNWAIVAGQQDTGWHSNTGTAPAPGVARVVGDRAYGRIPMVPGAGSTSYENGTVGNPLGVVPTYMSMWCGFPNTGAPLSVALATFTAASFTPILIATSGMAAGTYDVYYEMRA